MKLKYQFLYALLAAASLSIAAGSAVGISAGTYHTCAVLQKTNLLKCFGGNEHGALGLGDSDARGDDDGEMGDSLHTIALGVGRTAKAVAADYQVTCVILDDDTVKCFGYNINGQLGQGDKDSRGLDLSDMGDNLDVIKLGAGRIAVAVSVGAFHTCVILDNSQLKCFGYNALGQLGQGDKDDRGVESDQMGDALPPINLGTNREANAVSAGAAHTCVILDNAQVKCFGSNLYGQIGLGDLNYTSPRGNKPDHMGDDLPAIDLGIGRTASAIASGWYHTCVLLDNSKVKCFGRSDVGQIGLGQTFNRGDEPNEMGDDLPAVDLGSNQQALAVTAGAYHTCVLLGNSQVKCFGDNEYGQLGVGDTKTRGIDSTEMGDALPFVNLGTDRTAVAVVAGGYHTCVLLDNAKVKCFGWNDFGQLGLENTDDRGIDSDELGDDLDYVDLASDTASVPSLSPSLSPTQPTVSPTVNPAFCPTKPTEFDLDDDLGANVCAYPYCSRSDSVFHSGHVNEHLLVAVNKKNIGTSKWVPKQGSLKVSLVHGGSSGMIQEISLNGTLVNTGWRKESSKDNTLEFELIVSNPVSFLECSNEGGHGSEDCPLCELGLCSGDVYKDWTYYKDVTGKVYGDDMSNTGYAGDLCILTNIGLPLAQVGKGASLKSDLSGLSTWLKCEDGSKDVTNNRQTMAVNINFRECDV